MNANNPASANDKDSIDSIMSNLETLVNAIKAIQEETIGMQFELNQYKISMRQFGEEIDLLTNVKKVLIRLAKKEPHPIMKLEAPPPPKPVQEQRPKPQAKLISDGTILSHENLEWTTDPPTFKNNGIKLRYALSSNSILCAAQFSTDGSYFAFTDKKTLYIINTQDGSLVGTGSIPNTGSTEEYTRVIAFSSDNKYIAIAGKNQEIYVYDRANISDVKYSLKNHTNTVFSLDFSPNSERLYSGSYDGQICMWDTSNFKLLKTFNPAKDDYLVSFALSHDGQFLALNFVKGTVILLDSELEPDQQAINFKAHNGILHGLSLSNDDNLLAISSQDQTASLWQIRYPPKKKHTFSGHTNYVLTCCFSNDQNMLITGSKDETIKCWSIKTGQCIMTIRAHTNTIFQVQHHPEENSFLSCSGDGRICLWDYNPEIAN